MKKFYILCSLLFTQLNYISASCAPFLTPSKLAQDNTSFLSITPPPTTKKILEPLIEEESDNTKKGSTESVGTQTLSLGRNLCTLFWPRTHQLGLTNVKLVQILDIPIPKTNTTRKSLLYQGKNHCGDSLKISVDRF